MRTTKNAPAVAFTGGEGTKGHARVLASALALFLTASFAHEARSASAASPVRIVQADTAAKVDFNIPKQSLADALAAWSKQSGLQVLRRDTDGADLTASSVTGKFSPAEALTKMLAATGLTYEFVNDRTVRIASARSSAQTTSFSQDETVGVNLAQADQAMRKVETKSPVGDSSKEAQRASESNPDKNSDSSDKRIHEIVVTGTNIRGVAPKSSPVEIYTAEDIARTGATTTEQFIAKLPQNFGSRTQNATGANQPVSGGDRNDNAVTSIDLRGLGQGTTLTLLNGRRLGASDFGRSVDVSLIPVGAIKEVQVLTDGASAIYGSDAIGGVVNFILRDDFEGAETHASYGGVTSGSLRQGDFSQTFGHAWNSGRGLISYSYLKAEALEYADRDYTAASGPGTLLPDDKRHNVLATFSQDLGERLTVGGDFMFSRRETDSAQTTRPFVGFPAFDAFFTHNNKTDQAFANLDLDYALTERFNASVQASYSTIDTHSHSVTNEFNQAPPRLTPFETKTDHTALDLTATLDGVAFRLPGGDVRFSLGGGVLDEDYKGSRTTAAQPSNRDLGRKTTYAFAEILVPLVSEAQQIPFVRRLELSLAGRYTNYDDQSSPAVGQEFGDATDPKVGMYWAPSEWLGFRGTYGTSFRAPSLTQLDPSGGVATLFRSSNIAGAPAYRLSLAAYSAADLQPETAESFTLGFDLSPVQRRSFRLTGTYYNIDYTDRIALAPSGPDLLSNPQKYPDAIYQPATAAVVEEALGAAAFTIASSASALGALNGVNLSDRHAVAVALFALPRLFVSDNRFKNLALSRQEGFDVSIGDAFDAAWGRVDVGASITRIVSYRQQGSSTAPIVTVVDHRGQPVDLRARAFVGFSRGGFNGTVNLNYMDDYQNGDPIGPIASWTTADLSLAYGFDRASGGLTDGLSLNLSVQNLFDTDPPSVRLPTSLPPIGFDSVNANAVGRLVVVGLTKRWGRQP